VFPQAHVSFAFYQLVVHCGSAAMDAYRFELLSSLSSLKLGQFLIYSLCASLCKCKGQTAISACCFGAWTCKVGAKEILQSW